MNKKFLMYNTNKNDQEMMMMKTMYNFLRQFTNNFRKQVYCSFSSSSSSLADSETLKLKLDFLKNIISQVNCIQTMID